MTLHHDAARVRERLGQTDRAEELYRAILRLRSDDPVAIERVEEICRDQQRWEDLANILEQRTGSPTEALPNGPERRARLRELAGLYEERLERPYEAIDTLERLLRESSDEERGAADAVPPPVEETLAAHEALARLYSRVGLWAKVVESLQSRADLTGDKAKARALRLEVAAVYEKELALPDRAVEAYEAVLAEIPDDAQALEALDRLHEANGRFDDLQEILQRRAALGQGGREDRDRPAAREDPAGSPQQSRRRPPGPCASSAPRPSPTTICWRCCCATCGAPAWRTRRRACSRSGSSSSGGARGARPTWRASPS